MLFVIRVYLLFYAGTSPAKYEEVIHLLLKEVQDIVSKGITEKELNRAKEQIKGNLFLGLESVEQSDDSVR